LHKSFFRATALPYGGQIPFYTGLIELVFHCALQVDGTGIGRLDI
jgi:hypothetical protein